MSRIAAAPKPHPSGARRMRRAEDNVTSIAAAAIIALIIIAVVVTFQGQPVITEDNVVVHIDTVLFFQVTDPRAADYEIANYIQAIEQLTATTLRNVIGTLDLEATLTSR